MRATTILACLATLCHGTFAAFSAPSIDNLIISEEPSTLLEAVQVLISEVSDLKNENSRLRHDMDQAESQISTLRHSLQQQSQRLNSVSPTSNNNRSQRSLRGMVDEKLIEQNSELASRLQVLEGKLSCVSSDSDSTDIFFVGCNVHVRDGSGATQGVHQATIQSGRGNLIVGYNEAPSNGEAPELCSNSSAADIVSCRRDGGVWGKGLQTGIHNLVIGSGHSFTQHSGIVAGRNNAITGAGANAIGGRSNHASGEMSTITGGTENTASGKSSVVVGGFDNSAAGPDSVVSGGSYNVATGEVSAVIGGENNQAHGESSFISGGSMNEVKGDYSCSTNSFASISTGKESSIMGGRDVLSTLDETIISGKYFGLTAASIELPSLP